MGVRLQIRKAVLAATKSGFSLLEVLVALSLLAIVLTFLLQGFAGGLTNVHANDDHLQAAAVAEGVLAVASVHQRSPNVCWKPLRTLHRLRLRSHTATSAIGETQYIAYADSRTTMDYHEV